ncbi:MAG: hypothetical protein DRQ47_02495, partial [Gammaproteobacteria bacterium]
MAQIKMTTDQAVQALVNLTAKLTQMKKEGVATGSSLKQLQLQIDQIQRATAKAGTGITMLGNTLTITTAKTNKATVATTANTAATNKNTVATGKATKANKGLGISFANLAKGFIAMKLFQGALQLTKAYFDLIKTFDSLHFALVKTSGSMMEAANSQRFLFRLAEDFGVELVATTERFIKFSAAARQSGLSIKDTEAIFKSMTKAAGVLGLKTDETRGIYLALEQMLSKGKVTTEELRRQLGERLPGALGIMAASMGVSLTQLDKMLKKGEVLSAEVLPDFALAVEAAYGIETVDKINTVVAAQNRMTTNWQKFVKSFTEDDSKIKATMTMWYDFWSRVGRGAREAFATQGMTFQDAVSDAERDMEKTLKDSAIKKINLQAETGKKIEDLEKAKLANIAKMNKTDDKEELNRLNDAQDEILREIVEFNKKVVKAESEDASDRFDNHLRIFEEEKGLYDKALKDLEEKKAEMSKAIDTSGAFGYFTPHAKLTLKNEIEELEASLVELTR